MDLSGRDVLWSRDRLLTKIYGCLLLGAIRILVGRLAHARLYHEHIGLTGLGVLDSNLMISSRSTDFGATDDIEEGSSEEDFEGSIIDNLNLEIDCNRTKLDGVILDETEGHSSSGIRGLHGHRVVRGDGRIETFPDISPHNDNLCSSVENAFWFDSGREHREYNLQR